MWVFFLRFDEVWGTPAKNRRGSTRHFWQIFTDGYGVGGSKNKEELNGIQRCRHLQAEEMMDGEVGLWYWVGSLINGYGDLPVRLKGAIM